MGKYIKKGAALPFSVLRCKSVTDEHKRNRKHTRRFIMSKEELLQKINTLENFHICDGVLIEIEDLRKEGKSYQQIWKHFQMLDEMEF